MSNLTQNGTHLHVRCSNPPLQTLAAVAVGADAWNVVAPQAEDTGVVGGWLGRQGEGRQEDIGVGFKGAS